MNEILAPEAAYTAWAMGAQIETRWKDPDPDTAWAPCMSYKEFVGKFGNDSRTQFMNTTNFWEYRIRPDDVA